ncbi:MAG: carboxypeptidase-like regulatory domain-containing protein [Gammaproteobacteria bacterium]|nr:carboxypeptidase-like regulatory domain-containing protein [Gammaproteobacteria bacterium]
MKQYILLIILSIFCLSNSNAQTQNIRGKVTDKHSGLSLESVAIYFFQDEMVGTETDENGNFILENVPIGRVSLVFSSIEKKPVVLNNLELIGSKELVLEVTMEDSFESLKTIEIVSSSNKNRKTKNKHALVSARMVSAEEINKYAGSFNDVARMVMNYAGVKEVDDSKNDIVIRGNSSKGLLWRMNDVDIPNPNHFLV